jgi:small nuclear ribonucleoprotein (snRNP)-like protein
VRVISILPDFHPLPDDDFTKYLKERLTSYNYSFPITLEGGMRLLYGFEEEFPADVEDDLPLSVVHNANKYVVSLASVHGETRVFACTGVFIDRHKSSSRILTSGSLVQTIDKIDDNLEIQVQLPNNKLTKGTLEYYDLNFNIVVVGISNFRCPSILPLIKDVEGQVKPYKYVVVAIGRVFQTNKLMSTFGTLTRRKTKLDCRELKISTCKITKAGIGGPVIDYNGNFIGMNFYEKDQTPYLPVDQTMMLLMDLDSKRTVAETPVARPNSKRWPLPEPIWHYPSSVVRVYTSHRSKL